MRKIILAVSILASFISFSQTGSLVGKILDNNDKTPLIGVNLILEYKISSSNDISVAKLTPDQSGTATDLDGDFAFRNLEDGEYKLTISYIGYEQKTTENVYGNKTVKQQQKNIKLLSQNNIYDRNVTYKFTQNWKERKIARGKGTQ